MSNFKSFLGHTGNYFIAYIATKSLAFISIPVYTYLLSVEDFGVFNIFIAYSVIFSVLFSLSSETATARYYFENKTEEEFKRFVGTSARLTLFIFFVSSAIFILFSSKLSALMKIDSLLLYAFIPTSAFAILCNFFEQIYSAKMQSRKIAVASSIRAYSAFILSVLFILILPDKKYYGQILGTIVTMSFLSVYFFRQIRTCYTSAFEWKDVKYILSYTIPRIPYFLSGVIIIQFGRIFINGYSGFSNAGLYGFVASIGALMEMLINVTNQAWIPYYYQYMNSGNYESHDNDIKKIWKITLLAGLSLSAFGAEIGMLISNKAYHSFLYMIPFFVVGYLFYQCSFIYLRNMNFAKKTIWSTITVFVSGVANVLFSIYMLPKLGNNTAVIAFLISYLVMFVVSYMISKYIIKVYTTSLWLLLKPFVLFSFFFFLICTINYYSEFAIQLFFLKIILVCVYGIMAFWAEKASIQRFIFDKISQKK